MGRFRSASLPRNGGRALHFGYRSSPELGSQRSDQPGRGVSLPKSHSTPLRQGQSDPSLSDFRSRQQQEGVRRHDEARHGFDRGLGTHLRLDRTQHRFLVPEVESHQGAQRMRPDPPPRPLLGKSRARLAPQGYEGLRSFQPFFFPRRRGNLHALQHELPFVLDDPLHDLAPLELHGASHGGGEVDVPLLALLALDQLDLGGVAHSRNLLNCSLVISLDYKSKKKSGKRCSPTLFIQLTAKHEKKGPERPFFPGSLPMAKAERFPLLRLKRFR